MVYDDYMMCKRTDCLSLSSFMSNSRLKVKNLSINGIYFGDECSNSKLELSTDREMLFIYTEDEYVNVAKVPVSTINIMKFGIDDTEFTFYPLDE